MALTAALKVDGVAQDSSIFRQLNPKFRPELEAFMIELKTAKGKVDPSGMVTPTIKASVILLLRIIWFIIIIIIMMSKLAPQVLYCLVFKYSNCLICQTEHVGRRLCSWNNCLMLKLLICRLPSFRVNSKNYRSPTRVIRLKVAPNMADLISLKDSDRCLKGVLHLLPKISMFCAKSQNNQQLFEK